MDKPTFLRIAREMRELQIELAETEKKHRRPNLDMIVLRAEKRLDEALKAFGQDQKGLFDREEE